MTFDLIFPIFTLVSLPFPKIPSLHVLLLHSSNSFTFPVPSPPYYSIPFSFLLLCHSITILICYHSCDDGCCGDLRGCLCSLSGLSLKWHPIFLANLLLLLLQLLGAVSAYSPKHLPYKICSPCSVLCMFWPFCYDYSCQTKRVDNNLMQDTFKIIDGLTSDVDARQCVHIAFSSLLWSVECVHVSDCSGSVPWNSPNISYW